MGSSDHQPTSKNLQNKQENSGGVPPAPLMLKLDFSVRTIQMLSPLLDMESGTSFFCDFLVLSPRKAILFLWKVDDPLPKRKGKVTLFLCVMTHSSF